jgi:Mitochondrial ribosomal protein L27
MKALWLRSLIPTNNLWMDITKRSMSKYLSKAATKRLPLTSKRARKGYYKGKGATKEGHITSKAKFIPDRSKQLQLIVPDLTGFKVRSCWVYPSLCRAWQKPHNGLLLWFLQAQALHRILCIQDPARRPKDACGVTRLPDWISDEDNDDDDNVESDFKIGSEVFSRWGNKFIEFLNHRF